MISFLNVSLLNTPEKQKRIFFRLFLTFSILVSILGCIYYLQNNLATMMNDGVTRLNVANRVLFSRTPGLGQIGGIWPPLPSLLMIPTIWSNFMYYSGLSGTVNSMALFVISSYLITRIVFQITKSYLSALIAGLFFVLNPSLIYIQSTPMTESLIIGFSVISIYCLFLWAGERKNVLYLIIAAFFTLVLTLTRYEGWGFSFLSILVVGVTSWHKNRGWSRAEGDMILYGSFALFGLVLWLVYNLVIYGDMLNFIHEQGSTQYFVQQYVKQGGQLTKNNLLVSIYTYFSTSSLASGILALIASVFGLVIYLKKYFNKDSFLIPLLLFSPVIFHLVALYTGQTFIVYRYGLYTIPLIAFLIGILLSVPKNLLVKSIFLACIIFQIAINFFSNPVTPNLGEGVDKNTKYGQEVFQLAEFIQNSSSKRPVLIDSSLGGDSVMFIARIPMKDIVYQGNKPYWEEALQNPKLHVARVVVRTNRESNKLLEATESNPNFRTDFQIVFDGEFYKVYDRTY